MSRKIPQYPKKWKGSRTKEEIREAIEKVRDSRLPKQAQEGLERLGERIGESEWDELHNEYIRAETKLMYWDWLKENYYPPKSKNK